MLGLSVSEVEFPAVIICSEGFDLNAISAVVYHNTFRYMNTSMNEKIGLSPIQLAKLESKYMDEVIKCITLLNIYRKVMPLLLMF
jgi:hypothetical protein